MKKIIAVAGILVVITTLSSCLSTFYPLFTEKDLVFDPSLAGSWKAVKDAETLIFEKGNAARFSELPPSMQKLADRGYLVSVKNKEGKIEQVYYGFLTKLGGKLYFDFFPAPTVRQKTYDAFYKQQYVCLHSFYRIKFNNDRSFEFSLLKEEYLKDLINKKQISIRHEVLSDGSYLITAPTEQLQQYVIKYGDTPDAYENSSTYTKI